MRNQDERGKSEVYRGERNESGWDYGGKGNTANADVHCFNCNKSGHYQKDCKSPPYCFCCKKDGHKSSDCPKKKGLRVYGLGLPGQGFYSIRVPVKESVKKGAKGVMTILQGTASVDIIRTELKNIYRVNVN